jgi:hypothetical protein
LAERPGTPQEGELARLIAIQLSLKHRIPCKFTVGVPRPASTRPTASALKPDAAQQAQSLDTIFYRWIKALADYGWLITETEDIKIGRQIKFRKPGFNSEIRVTQRAHSDGKDFEAEHIMRPDPDKYGLDWSFCVFMTISLGELLHHINYTRDKTPFTTRREWETANATK